MSSGAAAVELTGVSRAYGAIQALLTLSLTIEPGETVALLGPSGSGKTTLLSLIAGEVAPSTGNVRIGATDLAQVQPGRELASLVGMIHQQFDLVPNLSSFQNVVVGRIGHWGFFRTLVSLVWPRDGAAAMAALHRVGVGERAGLRAGRLSGGEQQRVAIARLLVQDPALVLADEPVSSLDPARADEVIALLIETAREAGKTLIASIHAVELARRHFSRLIGLRNGAVQFDLPRGSVTEAMLADLYRLEGLRASS